jgi:hypothetical protein
MWNLANWNLYSEQVVNFTINYGQFHGSISMQEITNVGSPKYGKVAIAFQPKGHGFPNLTFHSPWDVAEFIGKLGLMSWNGEPVQGHRAPKDLQLPCTSAA